MNRRVAALIAALVDGAEEFRIAVSAGSLGETVVDAGLAAPGGIAAGLAIAAIAMGGFGRVACQPATAHSDLPWSVTTRSSQPVLACLGSQYAGWHLADPGEPGHALGSGPARALAAREPILADVPGLERVAAGVLVVECRSVPSARVVGEVAAACGLEPNELCLVLVPTTCLAGSVQVAARALESAIAKARHAGFPLARIVDGLGSSPLAPPHPDPVVAMGRTNDAILYGGAVHLFVQGPAAAARDLAQQLPSAASDRHGRFFADVLAEAGGEFYAVDAALFGPAVAHVTALDSGETFAAGGFEWDLVSRSFARAG
jgi:methenyltetrahydromethanopterin cyclohydrolase